MSGQKKYSGVVVPMVTPFTAKGNIDAAGVSNLVNHIIAGQSHPFVGGTTGEAASISEAQKKVLVAEVIKAAAGRSVVYAGISGNCLAESIEDAKAYHDLGAEVVVATLPFYYPLDDNQMLRYFEELADNIPLPLILYNIPVTTHISIPIEVVEKLSGHPNIAGFKDSEKGIERIEAATALWKDRQDFSYFLGWAVQSQYATALGADGIVPSSGNLVPAVYKAIVDAALAGDKERAIEAQAKADAVSLQYQKDRTLGHSLSAFKVMLSAYGLCQPHMLPPLYRMQPEEEKKVMEETLAGFGSLAQINSI